MCGDGDIRYVAVTKRTARKIYNCFGCEDEIKRGNKYYDTRAILDGSLGRGTWGRGRFCLVCKPVL